MPAEAGSHRPKKLRASFVFKLTREDSERRRGSVCCLRMRWGLGIWALFRGGDSRDRWRAADRFPQWDKLLRSAVGSCVLGSVMDLGEVAHTILHQHTLKGVARGRVAAGR